MDYIDSLLFASVLRIFQCLYDRAEAAEKKTGDLNISCVLEEKKKNCSKEYCRGLGGGGAGNHTHNSTFLTRLAAILKNFFASFVARNSYPLSLNILNNSKE